MAKLQSGTTKNIDLGPLKERVDRIAKRDPVHKNSASIVRAAVDSWVKAWDEAHPENPSTRPMEA